MKFSEKIVKLRKMKGLTQDEFASAVGVSRQAVYKWESGQSYPEVPKLLEMKLLFDISIDNLLDENYEVVMAEKPKRRRVKKEAPEAVAENKPEAVAEKEPEAVAEKKSEVESVSVSAPAVTVYELEPQEEEKPEEKKKGFFARIFGRR